MKKLYVVAALLMATTAAHAGNSISFEVEGHKIHIETPKDCNSLSCIRISAPGLSGSGFGFNSTKSTRNQDNDDAAPPAPKTAAAPVDPTPATPAPVSSAPPAPETIASTPVTPAIKETVTPAIKELAQRQRQARPCAAGPVAAPARPIGTPATPIGVWATEENKTVSSNPAATSFAVPSKTGEKILINMKPSDTKWTGRIHDPDTDRTYNSSMTMKGPNTLRVQGCAFNGMFCGGQTWTRISYRRTQQPRVEGPLAGIPQGPFRMPAKPFTFIPHSAGGALNRTYAYRPLPLPSRILF